MLKSLLLISLACASLQAFSQTVLPSPHRIVVENLTRTGLDLNIKGDYNQDIQVLPETQAKFGIMNYSPGITLHYKVTINEVYPHTVDICKNHSYFQATSKSHGAFIYVILKDLKGNFICTTINNPI